MEQQHACLQVLVVSLQVSLHNLSFNFSSANGLMGIFVRTGGDSEHKQGDLIIEHLTWDVFESERGW